MKTPKGFEYKVVYEPDMDKMVKALKILHEARIPHKESNSDEESPEELKTAGA